MLNTYTINGNKVEPGGSPGPGFWLDIGAPDLAELEDTARRFQIPPDYLTDSLDPAERPHTLNREGLTLVIARVSAPGREGELLFDTLPLGVIITPEAVITVCRQEGLAFSLLKDKLPPPAAEAEGGSAGAARPGLLLALTVLQQSCIRFIKHLQVLDDAAGKIEQSMLKSMRNEELERMMQVEKTLVYFLTSLKGNVMVMEKMQSSPALKLREAENELLADALTEGRQAEQMAAVYSDIVSSISNTFASMVSNNMNFVVKFLTAITLILMAPSIIVGLFGMNVPLPFQESRWALPLILLGTAGLCWGLWKFLSRKHWM